MELQFYVCKHCNNVVYLAHDAKHTPSCCGESRTTLVPNTVEASQEKHVPVLSSAQGLVTVKIGQVPHPMEDAHYIGFIALAHDGLVTFKHLTPGDEAVLTAPGGEGAVAYAWCNLHGLWKGVL